MIRWMLLGTVVSILGCGTAGLSTDDGGVAADAGSGGDAGISCERICQFTEAQCSDGRIRTCLVADGCLAWSDWQTCEAGYCDNTWRCGGCDDACEPGFSMCAAEGGRAFCSEDGEGCRIVEIEDCPNGCEAGDCCPDGTHLSPDGCVAD